MTGNHLELTTVFQQLGQTLVHNLRWIVATYFPYLFFNLASCLAHSASEQLQQALGDRGPARITEIKVAWNNPVSGIANPN